MSDNNVMFSREQLVQLYCALVSSGAIHPNLSTMEAAGIFQREVDKMRTSFQRCLQKPLGTKD